jgi:transposase
MDVEQFKDDVREGRIDTDRLVDLHVTLQRRLEQMSQELSDTTKQLNQAQRRIEELEQQLRGPTKKVDEPFSVAAEEKRQEARGKKKPKRKRPKRRGRITTKDKIARAARTEKVFPAGVPEADCKLSHTRPVWRFENNQAVLIAYEIYRGPKNQYGQIDGVLGRSEFGIEIVMAIAYQVYVVGLSFDKVCQVLNFFQNMQLRKSQVDALLNQLWRHWESEFETLCTLLANSAVVHADETGWSINSVWAFLSENVRLLFFGVHKDGQTLQQILDPATFGGVVVSDDAAVYASFTRSQKCWAHLLRKAIKLTLTEPDNEEYRAFADQLLEIYREACRVKRDRRLSDAGRAKKVAELDDEILELCVAMWTSQMPPQEGPANDYRLLVNELMRLMLAEQLFTFVTAETVAAPSGQATAVPGTNNEAERTLRPAADARKTGRTSKTVRGARRRTVIVSVLESLRQYLPTFTLSTVTAEIGRWCDTGQSCFAAFLSRLNLPPPENSTLDQVLPLPSG